MMYPFQERDRFWLSLDELDQLPATADVVNQLVAAALTEPEAAPPNAEGVRIIKSPAESRSGVDYPSVKLKYRLNELTTVARDHYLRWYVELLLVQEYDEAAESTDELAAVLVWR